MTDLSTRRLPAAAIATALLAAACAAPTPYRPATAGEGGYTDTELREGLWRVTFRGNESTSRETVETYLLYRAAELTLREGYRWFVVTERGTEVDIDYEPGTAPVFGVHPHARVGFGHQPFPYYAYGYAWGPPAYHVERQYRAVAYVSMHRDEPEAGVAAYDATALEEALRPRIQRPGEAE